MVSQETIKILVEAAQAIAQFQKIKEMASQLKTNWQDSSKALQTWGTNMIESGKRTIAFGKQVQWSGAQLTVGLTLPLVAFGKSSLEIAAQVNKDWARIQKVYGDTAEEQAAFTDDMNNILKPAVQSLSHTYAEHQSVILDVTEAWAAMGKTGKELSRVTKETMDFAIAGDIELTQATEGLRSVMATYGLTLEQTRSELAAFNAIENATALTMNEIAIAFPKVSSAFKLMNITAREGVAIMAGMRQRGVQATEAAQALKFGLTRLASPTKQAAEQLAQYSINLFDANGKMRSGVEVMIEVAKKTKSMTDEQRLAFLTIVFGRRQVDRLSKALDAMIDPTSDFTRAMKVAGDDTKNLAKYTEEINILLDSEAYKLQRAKIDYENLKIEVGNRLLPILTDLLERINGLLGTFDKLSPATKDFIIKSGMVAAALGPVIMYMGLLIQLGGWAKIALGAVAKVLGVGAGGLAGAFGLVTAAIGAMIAAWFGIEKLNIPSWAKKILQAILTGPVNGVMALIDSVKNWKQHWQEMKDTTSRIVDSISNFVQEKFNALKEFFVDLWDKVKEIFRSAWEWIQNTVFFKILEAIYQMARLQFLAILYVIVSVMDGISKAIFAVWSWIKGIWDKYLADIFWAIVDKFNQIYSAVSSKVMAVYNTIRDWFNKIYNFIRPILDSIRVAVVNAWDRIKSSVTSKANALYNAIKDPFIRARDKVLEVVRGAWNWGRNLLQNFIDGVKSMGDSLKNAIIEKIPAPIRKYLGIESAPEAGPLKNMDKWMPNMIKMMTDQINKGSVDLLQSFQKITTGIQMTLSPANISQGAEGRETSLGQIERGPQIVINNLTINASDKEGGEEAGRAFKEMIQSI